MELKEKIYRYWNLAADDYNQGLSLNRSRQDKKTARWQSLFCNAFPADARTILDVGTGPGIIAIMLAERGYEVSGVDFSPDMLQYARENADERNLMIRFEQGDAESLPFADNTFDIVVSRHMLWTAVHPQAVVQEWHRVLKPGGKIVYVDGNWYKTNKTLKRKLQYGLSVFLTMVTELRDPRSDDLTEEMKQSLWSVKADRPEYDYELLKNSGFSHIDMIESIEPYVSDWVEYLKEGYWGPRFLVSATKESNSLP